MFNISTDSSSLNIFLYSLPHLLKTIERPNMDRHNIYPEQ